MFYRSIKSTPKKRKKVVQTITQQKKFSIFFFLEKAKKTFNLQGMPTLLTMAYSEKRGVIIMFPFLVVAIALLPFISCKKEALTDPDLNSTASGALLVATATSTPTVDAGPALRVISPTSSSAKLTGSGSDARGSVTFRWKQTRGNFTATISQPTSATTDISDLKPGLYTFTLTATNKNGTSSIDSTTVSVYKKMTWTIEGVTREALVHPPTGAGSGPAPVIIAFHGHTGTDSGYSDKGFELSWPEAIVVYPQGLRTKSGNDRAGKKSGWQNSVGEINPFTGVQDQDLKFFDAMLSTFQAKLNANTKLVFVHGWSNGADFIYNVLWPARRNNLAALAPAGAALRSTDGRKPIPVIHTAGTQDEDISFSKQEQGVESIRTLDKCRSIGTTWITGPSGILGTQYASPINDPVVFLQYNGTHNFPYTVPPMMVKFFKQIAGQ